MGVWGAGNFENDSARDYVGDVVEEMRQRVDDILADEERCALDEEGEGVLIPTLVMLSLLYDHCRAPAPDLEKVQGWKGHYLAIFDEEIDGFDPGYDAEGFSEYKKERRRIIEETFARLEAQARDFSTKAADLKLNEGAA